jgi:hypothetical protein
MFQMRVEDFILVNCITSSSGLTSNFASDWEKLQ